ncbi:hypothetical protein PUNSTDRAFT_64213 [Punctularia strigosozonata HHB-11173 SS5]|uniref:uncharacterized protein n=1 Tax=Punctularia strigosozonata (strain HHB-11173) TaxID=741275 RepID=UPI0004417CD6|nr:uncharacterized protein PUNSTDRAFT_64213 [Punctularia strigosozonata HHB-11173 SS5]EIN10125.1 hypothetical protein PUNSTDRAFT_64213 [Punctularia strigosozonata HHB-11173 SS5]
MPSANYPRITDTHRLIPSGVPSAYLYVENTVRYQPDTPQGGVEFEHLVPDGNHLVYSPPTKSGADSPRETYAVALLHQMRCMDIIRDEYNSRAAQLDDPLLRHCMNYLRQSILCLADTRLEEVRLPLPGESIFAGDYICKDWSAVYDAAEKRR